MKFLGICLLLTMSVSCIKTAEQVNREKRFESMTEQMQDSRGLVADMVTQMKDMQSQLNKINGRLDEIEHKNSKVDPDGIRKMNENMNLISSQQQTDKAQMDQIQNELKEQRAFLEKITASLSNVNKASSSGSQKKSAKSELNDALELVKSNEYSKARTELEALIDHADLSPGDHNKVFHGLGRVEFFTKNYEKGLVYFSKIYSKYPKSSLAGNSLLFIGRTLEKMGKKDEAKQAYAKVVEDYPGSKEASEAKKEL